MLHIYLLTALNIIFIGFYMRARMKQDLKQVIIFQPGAVILSLLIAASSLFMPETDSKITWVVLIGMGIALIGDFLNMDMSSPKVVIRALVIAVVAYLIYGIGLTLVNGFHFQDLYLGIPLLLFYAAFMRYLWPSLGEMRIPALIYGLVLPFAFLRAVSTFYSPAFTMWQSVFLSLGTLFLYLGDIEFAVDTYKKKLPLMFGPILYAGGQLLIAQGAIPWEA